MLRPTLGSFVRAAAFVLTVLGMTTIVPAHAAAQEEVHSLSDLSELPKLANTKQAVRTISKAYPRKLQNRNITGKVQLKFIVNADGKVDVESIEVVATAVEELGEAARVAAAGLEFVPGKIDGSAVRTAVIFPISFGL